MKLKTFVLTATLLFSSFTQAVDTIAKYEFSHHSNEDRNAYQVTAEIRENMTLSVLVNKIEDGYQRMPFPSEYETVLETKYDLKAFEFDMINFRVNHFSQVKIVTNHHQVVCMVMPNPMMYFDSLSLNPDSYSNGGPVRLGMKLVLGPQGCWMRTSITPNNKVDTDKARTLKDIIKLITLNKIQKDL